MGKIVGSNKDVTEETLFVGSEIPKYGVLTNHEMELEKVYKTSNFLYFKRKFLFQPFYELLNPNFELFYLR